MYDIIKSVLDHTFHLRGYEMNKETVLQLIETHKSKEPFFLAIDGRCAAGKTTLSAELANTLNCNLIHMDDFYLPFALRTPEQMALPGGNIDFERLINKVILPLKEGKSIWYEPYECHKGTFLAPCYLACEKSCILEGSYSCHPVLQEFLDFKVFLDISSDIQIKRISHRNPDFLEMFQSTWIPREEFYFDTYNIKRICDLILTGDKNKRMQ